MSEQKLDFSSELKPLLERIDELIGELNYYAYGKSESGNRCPAWEDFAMACGALERAQERIEEIL